MRARRAEFDNVDTAADDVALIAFTSGTTGKPKGTMHFHRDVMAICDCFPRSTLQPAADDVFFGSPPLAFTFGLGGLVTFPMRVGASAVLLEAAPPDVLLQAIQEYRASVCFTSPTAYRMMRGKADSCDLTSLSKCVSAGEPLPLPTFEAWQRAHRSRDHRRHRRDRDAAHLHLRRGRAHPPGRDRHARAGLPGDRRRRGDAPAAARRSRPARGARADRLPLSRRRAAEDYVQNGWNLTGDAYMVDEDGYFWFQARTDDMIISAGYNIAGPEVEEALLEHAGGRRVRGGRRARSGARPDRQGVRRAAPGRRRRGPAAQGAAGVREGSASPPTSIRARSSSSTPCRAPRPARCSASGCARWKSSAPPLRPPERTMQILQPPGWPRPRGYANGIAARRPHGVRRRPDRLGRSRRDRFRRSRRRRSGRRSRTRSPCCARRGAGPEHVARMTWYVTDKREYLARARELGEAYRALMGRHYPGDGRGRGQGADRGPRQGRDRDHGGRPEITGPAIARSPPAAEARRLARRSNPPRGGSLATGHRAPAAWPLPDLS